MHTARTKDGNHPTKNKLLYFGLIDRNCVLLSFKTTCNEKENLQSKLEVVVSFLEKSLKKNKKSATSWQESFAEIAVQLI